MRGLDETDIEILQLLSEDARRPYSDIAEETGVSQPTISNRVERLQEMEVIHRFTLDLDRSILHDGVSVLIDVDTTAESVDTVARAFEAEDEVHTVYTTADAHVIAITVCRPEHVKDLVARTVPESEYSDYKVKLLSRTSSDPTVQDPELSVNCDSCGNRVISENGVTTRIEGSLYHFCCGRCETAFKEKYETLRENV